MLIAPVQFIFDYIRLEFCSRRPDLDWFNFSWLSNEKLHPAALAFKDSTIEFLEKRARLVPIDDETMECNGNSKNINHNRGFDDIEINSKATDINTLTRRIFQQHRSEREEADNLIDSVQTILKYYRLKTALGETITLKEESLVRTISSRMNISIEKDEEIMSWRDKLFHGTLADKITAKVREGNLLHFNLPVFIINDYLQFIFSARYRKKYIRQFKL